MQSSKEIKIGAILSYVIIVINMLIGILYTPILTAKLGQTEYGYQTAATMLVTVPLFLLFVFFRKYIMRGVGRAGIKG